ncbi:hypothetical protein BSR55_01805 [Acinetobacter bereziniae]|nr:hypothetical protein BSR55_01805 [Acinetobacter bereziniae]
MYNKSYMDIIGHMVVKMNVSDKTISVESTIKIINKIPTITKQETTAQRKSPKSNLRAFSYLTF